MAIKLFRTLNLNHIEVGCELSHVKQSVYYALILVQILFGINYGASKIIVEQLDPIIWSNARFFFAGIGMLIITLVMRRPHPKLTKEFLLPIVPLSLLGMALGQGLFLFGLKGTTSINTAIITSSIPILTLIIVVIRRHEHLTLNKLIGIVLSFCGVIFIRDLSSVSFGAETLNGDLLVFLGALCFALYLSFGKSFLAKHDNLWVTTWMFFISAIAMTLVNIPKFGHTELPELEGTFLACVIFSIIGATVITYFLSNWALAKAPSGNVALFIYMQPIVAGTIGYFFLGETLSVRIIICSVLIMSGLIISILPTLLKGKEKSDINLDDLS